MEQFKAFLQRMMAGRNGVDQLSRALSWISLGILLLSVILTSQFLDVLWLIVYAYSLFRVFSRNIYKRSQENQWYVNHMLRIRAEYSQRKKRFHNRKQYCYFKCPQCNAWLRLPRGTGVVKVTCGKCKHMFKYDAR